MFQKILEALETAAEVRAVVDDVEVPSERCLEKPSGYLVFKDEVLQENPLTIRRLLAHKLHLEFHGVTKAHRQGAGKVLILRGGDEVIKVSEIKILRRHRFDKLNHGL